MFGVRFIMLYLSVHTIIAINQPFMLFELRKDPWTISATDLRILLNLEYRVIRSESSPVPLLRFTLYIIVQSYG